jgi:hypothetical protein
MLACLTQDLHHRDRAVWEPRRRHLVGAIERGEFAVAFLRRLAVDIDRVLLEVDQPDLGDTGGGIGRDRLRRRASMRDTDTPVPGSL